MERKKLLRSQKILLQMKSEKVQEAIRLAKARQKEVRATMDMILTEEHNVPKNELSLWRLSKDEQAVEKIEPEKEKKNNKDKDN